MQLTAGMTLGPYEIVGKIGAGGMGTVYRARDTRLDRDVAAAPAVGRPVAMFPISSAFMLQLEEFRLPHYDVAPDGRFLVRELATGRDDDPVTLIVSTGSHE